jgi:NhaB family Na+:H+ antiporter
MANTVTAGFVRNFLGHSPQWFKLTILGFLILNPILLIATNPYIVGWVLVLEFIFCLAMALKCYPLLPGGLLALESVFIGLTSPATVLHEVKGNLEVILLLIFMVAGIYFMQNLLLFLFTKVLIKIRNKIMLSLIFCLMGAILSAFLDALTVTAVVIAVSVGFYSVYHKVASGKDFNHAHDHTKDAELEAAHREDLDQFRSFLRSLIMHAAVGTALGGVCTLVGEPQNLLIAKVAGWDFLEFLFRMAPVTMPVLFSGLLTCVLVEKFRIFGYGAKIPAQVLQILKDHDAEQTKKRTKRDISALVVQGMIALWLIVALIFHLGEVGLIGLSVIVLCTAFNGITEEHQIGKAFEEALPFTALLVVFFVIVAVIQDQGLFAPIIEFVLSLNGMDRIAGFYVANGLLSMISDNVFVATVYINQVKDALLAGTIDRDTFDLMAVAINTGTNIPSVATPNGQAAFLFLLTSAIAPLIRLSYMKMVVMALPYTIVMSLVGLFATYQLLQPVTDVMYEKHLINHHVAGEKVSGSQH